MALPRRTTKNEDLLPLDRAFRALEDAHKSFKEFSTKETVESNDTLKDALGSAKKKIKKLLQRKEILIQLWDEGFESGSGSRKR